MAESSPIKTVQRTLEILHAYQPDLSKNFGLVSQIIVDGLTKDVRKDK